jgi:hypothetical protein
LQAKVGELTMTAELLEAKIERLETHRPLGRRRSRRGAGRSRPPPPKSTAFCGSRASGASHGRPSIATAAQPRWLSASAPARAGAWRMRTWWWRSDSL